MTINASQGERPWTKAHLQSERSLEFWADWVGGRRPGLGKKHTEQRAIANRVPGTSKMRKKRICLMLFRHLACVNAPMTAMSACPAGLPERDTTGRKSRQTMATFSHLCVSGCPCPCGCPNPICRVGGHKAQQPCEDARPATFMLNLRWRGAIAPPLKRRATRSLQLHGNPLPWPHFAYLGFWPHRGVRFGEAKTPGPTARRIRHKSSPPLFREASAAGLEATPARVPPVHQIAEVMPAATSSASGGDRRRLPNPITVYRAETGKDAQLVPQRVPLLNAWRWQISSKPRWSSSNRPSPAEALTQFINAHGHKLTSQSVEELKQQANELDKKDWHVQATPSMPGLDHDTEADPLSWNEIEEVLLKHMPTLRKIPHDVITAVRVLVQQLAQSRGVPAGLILVLPKLLWPATPEVIKMRGRQRSKTIYANLRLAQAGEWQTLLMQFRGISVPEVSYSHDAKHEISEARAQELIQAARSGSPLGKKWRQITSGLPVRKDLASWAKATQLLRPRGDNIQLPSPAIAASEQSRHDFLRAIARLKPGRAMDPGGWSHECAQQLFSAPCHMQHLSDWAKRFLYELGREHPMRQMVWTARSALLGKPNSGIRPLLIGNLWLKIGAADLTKAFLDHMPAHLKHMQVGIGKSEGSISMARYIQQLAADDENMSFLQIDCENAFGSLRREAIVPLLREAGCDMHGEAGVRLASWLNKHLAQPMRAIDPLDLTATQGIFETQDGLPQGDPLSAAVFGMTIAAALYLTQADAHTTLHCHAYLDDAIIAAQATELRAIFPKLEQRLAAAGLAIR